MGARDEEPRASGPTGCLEWMVSQSTRNSLILLLCAFIFFNIGLLIRMVL